MEPYGVTLWSSAAWRDEAVAWLDARLGEAGLERTGEVDQPHLRPWATALSAPTTGGRVWLKAAGPGTAFEVGLYELLHRVAPDHVLPPLATDTERGWLVLPDGGPTLGERLAGPALVDALAAALPHYGRLQRILAPQAETLLALGVPDMRPPAMPERFDEALAAARRYEGADPDALRGLAALRPDFVAWCDELAGRPGPVSLDHNDLHPWNVLAGPDGSLERPRFFDWGDSAVAPAFASMLVCLRVAGENIPGLADDTAPVVVRLRDAYLAAFDDVAPHGELVDSLELACRVGHVARALAWDRVVQALDPADRTDYWESTPYEWMVSLLRSTR
ncbi:MAG TPA: phosphotransferase [Acidimicrobiales bacterium]